jgi:hypothetical protein
LRAGQADAMKDIVPSANEPIVVWDTDNTQAQIVIGDGTKKVSALSKIGYVPVSSGNISANFGESVTVGTVNGTDLKFTMPA